ncbi:hypothetical protein F6P94_23685 (plasmid) [Escherichia coli]|nr:hypothetical protein F6P94_23685 [Escherichia coli]
MKTYVKVKWPLGVSVRSRRQLVRTVDFYLLPSTAKPHTGFCKILNNGRSGISASMHKAPAYGRALCSVRETRRLVPV